MARKRYNGFIYQRIVVFIFIFLNGLFTAAPFIQASGYNIHAINASTLSLQNQGCEQEESSLNDIADKQQECHIVIRNRRNFSNEFYTVKDYHLSDGINKDSGDLNFTDSFLLIRPQYYSFLSIFYLF